MEALANGNFAIADMEIEEVVPGNSATQADLPHFGCRNLQVPQKTAYDPLVDQRSCSLRVADALGNICGPLSVADEERLGASAHSTLNTLYREG